MTNIAHERCDKRHKLQTEGRGFYLPGKVTNTRRKKQGDQCVVVRCKQRHWRESKNFYI